MENATTSNQSESGMSSELLMKRKREEMDDTTVLGEGQSQVVVQSDIWFEDGNVILEAEKTQFRVHRGVLAKYSIAFRELHLPDHDCPIVELSDTAEDLRYLLDALYEWSFRSLKCLPISMVVALLRLGHKYRIKKLRNEIVTRLLQEWPTDYEEWISRRRPDIQSIEAEDERIVLQQMLSVALECNLRCILPSLYLTILTLFSLDEIEAGFTAQNGKRLNFPLEERLTMVAGLIRLRYALSTKGWPSFNKIPERGCLSSASTQSCFKAKSALYSKDFGLVGEEFLQGARPNLFPMSPDVSSRLCLICLGAVEEYNKSRRELWNMLPSFFRLRGWEELEHV